jgi:hypothetical protein
MGRYAHDVGSVPLFSNPHPGPSDIFCRAVIPLTKIGLLLNRPDYIDEGKISSPLSQYSSDVLHYLQRSTSSCSILTT